ncbi:MAG TPA: acetyltransferase [Acetivibrio sp.]|uniref:acetyltransferase n=1 Tax=Acetivibrio sp. TaxID=1872092 RepID=UPI002BE0E9C0|nr:acetyltransferase [Acetivibrio sp.]HOM02481.1 acetyltransferase [Acetivibrio sp.]
MNKKILLIGGGGHCKSVLDSLLDLNEYDDIGIIDSMGNIGSTVLGIPILGSDKDLPSLYKAGYRHGFVTVGSVGNPALRIKLFNTLCEMGFIIPNIVDASAKVSKHTQIGKGVFIGKQAIVNAGAVIGNGAIINSGAIIEHDCEIGEFVHIAPGTVLCGGVKVGKHSHIGSNAAVKQQVCIGSNCLIGMGSVVTKDIGDNITAYGNPCREVEKL